MKRGRTVVVVDDLSNGRLENLEPVKKDVVFVNHDVSRDLSGLLEVNGVSEIFHLACFPRQISFQNPQRDAEVNLVSTVNCLELARRNGAKLLFTSNTGIVSDPLSLPVDESFRPSPSTPYDCHKLASEYLLSAYHRMYGVPTVVVRFASIYGPRQRVNPALGWRPVIPEFVTKLLRSEAPTITGDGGQTRDFLFVRDAVDGVIRAMESKAPEANSGGMFILGTNTETSVKDLFCKIQAIVGNDPTVLPRHGPMKKDDITRMRYDYSKAKNSFGFQPATDLDRGLAETVEFLRRDAVG